MLAEHRAEIEEMTEEMKKVSSDSLEEMLESLKQQQAGQLP